MVLEGHEVTSQPGDCPDHAQRLVQPTRGFT